MPTTTIGVGPHQMQVELAANFADRAQGLMHREALPQDKGMLFVYRDEQPRSFWMKNTPLPLSIAFATRDGKIVKIKGMSPFSTSPVKSLYPASYALEVNEGWFEANDVAVGDTLTNLPPLSEE
jgi:hypothetical protein